MVLRFFAPWGDDHDLELTIPNGFNWTVGVLTLVVCGVD